MAARATPEGLYLPSPRELSHQAWFSPSKIPNLCKDSLIRHLPSPPEFTRTFWAPRSVTHQSQSNQRGVISWQILYSRSCQPRLRSSDLLFKAPYSPEYNLGPVLAQPPDPLAPVSPGSWASAVWTAFWGVPASFPTWERRHHAPTRPPARCPLRSAARMDRASPELPRALCSGQGSGTRPCYQPDVPPSASPVELT